MGRTETARRRHVLVLGPDGAGKSTVTEALERRAAAAGIAVTRAHWRPGLVPPRRSEPGGPPVVDPHGTAPRGAIATLVRIVLLVIDFSAGSRIAWRRAADRGLLLVERGWYDMCVDPRRYRLPDWAAGRLETLGRLLPRADLAVLLVGDPVELAARKGEVDAVETDRQLREWRRLAPLAARRVVTVDTTATTPDEAATEAWDRIGGGARTPGRTPWRAVPLAAPRLDLRAAGDAAPAFSVHRPFRPGARVAARVGRSLWSTGLTRRVDPPVDGLGELLATLDLPASGAVAFRSSAPGRWVIGVTAHGRLEVVVKVGSPDDAGLRSEAELLAQLQGADLPAVTPSVRWAGRWRERFVLATEALTHDPTAPVTLDELVPLASALVRGVDGPGPLLHGDLAPWNVSRSPAGIAVVDWEEARRGRAPLHDLTHYVVRSGTLLGTIQPQEAARLLTDPGSPGWRHLELVDEEPGAAAGLVRAYLRRTTTVNPQELRFRAALDDELP